MVNRRIKQIVALAIAIGFAASIVFFVPHVPNNSPFTYEILIPNNLINSSSSLYSHIPSVFYYQNVSVIQGASAAPISNIIAATNATDLMQFTSFILNQSNITYSQSSGALECMFSDQFLQPVCSNSTYEWLLFYSSGAGLTLYKNQGTPSLSSINLKSIEGNNITMVLAYIDINGGSASTNSSGIPPFPGQ